MSVSGGQTLSNEVRTTVINASEITAGTENLEERNPAAEDREIVGFNSHFEGDIGDGNHPTVQISVGSPPFDIWGTDGLAGDVVATVQDDRDLYWRHEFSMHADTANGVGLMTDLSHTMWFGRGDGFLWREDQELVVQAFLPSGASDASTLINCIYWTHL